MDIVFTHKTLVNPELLDRQLKQALPTQCLGVSVNKRGVIVHMVDNATPDDRQTAAVVLNAHDPAALTPKQQLARQLRQAVNAMEGTPLDNLTAGQIATLVKALAFAQGWVEDDGTLRRWR